MQISNSNRSAIITGASSKLGSEIAKFLAAKGYNLALHFAESESKITELKAELLQNHQIKIITLKANFSKNFSAANFIQAAKNQLGSLDLLINNAAIFNRDTAQNFTPESLAAHFQINCFTPLLLAQEFTKHSVAPANIINLNDSRIKNLNNSFYSYYLSKQSLDYAMRCLAHEVAPQCRINNINLGIVNQSHNVSQEIYEKLINATALQRPVEIADILATIELILKSNTMTCSNIDIDAGTPLHT